MVATVRCPLGDLAGPGDDAPVWTRAIVELQGRGRADVVELTCAKVRLPAGLLVSLPAAAAILAQRGSRIALLDLEVAARRTLAQFHLEGHAHPGLSPLPGPVPALSQDGQGAYTIAMEDGAVVVVTLHPMSSLTQQLSLISSHDWLQGLACSRVEVDLVHFDHVTSLVVAWLLQMVQSAKPAALELRRVPASVAIQLRQLRLNHLMGIPDLKA